MASTRQDSCFAGGAAIPPAGGELALGRLRVRLPRIFGFCNGVANALRLVERTLDHAPAGTVWLLGDIIHNDTVNQRLRDRGVRILSEGAARTGDWPAFAPGDTVVVPAFGLPLAQAQRLAVLAAATELRVVDTTCGYVKRIWRFVADQAAAGATVFILGKPHHPETLATLSRATGPGNCVILLPHAAAAREVAARSLAQALPDWPAAQLLNPARFNRRQWALAVQTTLLQEEVAATEQVLAATARQLGAAFASAATVCGATRDRQDAAAALCASGCDLYLVVGGFSSSNTAQLLRLARRHGPAYFIGGAADLNATEIRHYEPESGAWRHDHGWLPAGAVTVGVLAGASCPPADIAGLLAALRTLGGAEPAGGR